MKLRSPLYWTIGLSVLLHGALFVVVGQFDFDSLQRSTIEVEIVLENGIPNSGAPVRQGRSKPVPVKHLVQEPKIEASVTSDDVIQKTELETSVAAELGSVEGTSASSEIVSGVNGGSSAALQSAEAKYLSEVRRLLESKKNYPMAARRLGHHGRVIVRFVVGRDGQIREAKIVEPSRSDILNRAARSLIENLGGLKPFPLEIRLAEWAVVVPIEYQM